MAEVAKPLDADLSKAAGHLSPDEDSSQDETVSPDDDVSQTDSGERG